MEWAGDDPCFTCYVNFPNDPTAVEVVFNSLLDSRGSNILFAEEIAKESAEGSLSGRVTSEIDALPLIHQRGWCPDHVEAFLKDDRLPNLLIRVCRERFEEADFFDPENGLT